MNLREWENEEEWIADDNRSKYIIWKNELITWLTIDVPMGFGTILPMIAGWQSFSIIVKIVSIIASSISLIKLGVSDYYVIKSYVSWRLGLREMRRFHNENPRPE